MSAVKASQRWTTGYPGRDYTHTAAIRGGGGGTGTYQVRGPLLAHHSPAITAVMRY